MITRLKFISPSPACQSPPWIFNNFHIFRRESLKTFYVPLLLGGGLDQTYMPLHPFRKHSWLVLVVVQKSGRIPPVLVVSKQLPTLDQCESVAQFCGSSSSAMPSWSYQQQRGNGFPPHPRRGEKKRAKCNKGMLCFYKFDMFFFFCVAQGNAFWISYLTQMSDINRVRCKKHLHFNVALLYSKLQTHPEQTATLEAAVGDVSWCTWSKQLKLFALEAVGFPLTTSRNTCWIHSGKLT